MTALTNSRKDKSLRFEFPPQIGVLFWLPVMYTSACCHLVPCVPNFFKETYTERIQGMEAVPITDEKGKGKRRKKKPATQESSWNSPQLPNMTEESQMRWEGDKTDSVQCYLPADWNKSKGEADQVQRVLYPNGAPCGHCCCKQSIDGSLSDSFTLHFMESFPSSSSLGRTPQACVAVSWLVATKPR